MRPFVLNDKTRTLLWCSLGFMLFARLLCNALIPLTDTSEARYGEIARKMLETGDWITPQHDYGVPFWAKPPLSTWLSAFSMKLFGVNEFAARLPSLLLGMAMLTLIWRWCASRRGRDFALSACTALAGMSLFFMADGAVMTDSSLAFCTTLTMVAFWQALQPSQHSPLRQKIWGYLFFAGLGLGLLAKGPLIIVLTFMPILPWLLFRKSGHEAGGVASPLREHLPPPEHLPVRRCLSRREYWLRVWRALPWVRGSGLMLLIALPWYLVAEHKTPGFLSYFILGEHFGRFLDAGWSGDKYGHAHAEPIGKIWVFWLMAALPWSFVFIANFKKLLRRDGRRSAANNDWLSYLWLWAFTPMVFFTFAHNTIWTYPLPTLPAFAVLAMELQTGGGNETPLWRRLAALNFISPAVLLSVAALYASGHHAILKSSQKDSAEYYLKVRPNPESGLYYFRRRYYSGEFYSAGNARMIEAGQTSALLGNGRTDFLVIYPDDLAHLPPSLRQRFKPLHKFGNLIMLREIDAPKIADNWEVVPRDALAHETVLAHK